MSQIETTLIIVFSGFFAGMLIAVSCFTLCKFLDAYYKNNPIELQDSQDSESWEADMNDESEEDIEEDNSNQVEEV